MITFLVCLTLLVAACFSYRRCLERLVGLDTAAPTSCGRFYGGVDCVPLPRRRIFLSLPASLAAHRLMQNRRAAYLPGGGVMPAVLLAMIFKLRHNHAKSNS